MLRPVTTDICPPKGWRYRFPETGHEVTAPHPSLFLNECRVHMEANGLPIQPGWKQKIWNEACQQHPEWSCEDDGQIKRDWESGDVWRFLTTLWEAMEQGATQISREEQIRRLEICKQCPKKTIIQCSLGCGKLAEILSRLALGGSKPIQHELHKHHCGVCGCELTSLTSYPLEVLRAVDEKLGTGGDLPEGCWKRID